MDTVLLGSECQGALRCEDMRGPGALDDAGPHPADPDAPGPDDADRADGGAACEVGDPCTCITTLPAPAARFALDESAGVLTHDGRGANPGLLMNFSEPAWTSGIVAGALAFDGADDHVVVGALERPLRSLSLWLKPASTHVVTSETSAMLPSAHGPFNSWISPEHAYTNDDEFALAVGVVGVFKLQHWGGFQLDQQIPPDANILGISVLVDTANLGLLGYFSVELSQDGGYSHTDANYGWGQLVAGSPLQHAGGIDKLWGKSWRASDFSDANFRVCASFGGIVNTMYIDYVAVQIHYTPYALGRTLIGLTGGLELAVADEDSMEVTLRGDPGATVVVNGAVGGALLADQWNHVAVTSSLALAVSDLRLGGSVANPMFPFHGTMDEVLLFEEALSVYELEALYRAPSCAP